MITSQIIMLATGIMTAEGWNPVSESLTYRNHNPGALRSSPFAIGTLDNFAVFINDMVGFFALCWDLAKKCKGETVTNLGPNSTLYDLIKVYTAETEPQRLENYTMIVQRIADVARGTSLIHFTQ